MNGMEEKSTIIYLQAKLIYLSGGWIFLTKRYYIFEILKQFGMLEAMSYTTIRNKRLRL